MRNFEATMALAWGGLAVFAAVGWIFDQMSIIAVVGYTAVAVMWAVLWFKKHQRVAAALADD